MSTNTRILEIKKMIYNDSKIQEDIGAAIAEKAKGSVEDIHTASDGYHFNLKDNNSKDLSNDIFSAICGVLEDKCEDINTIEPRKLFNVLPVNDSKDYTIII